MLLHVHVRAVEPPLPPPPQISIGRSILIRKVVYYAIFQLVVAP